MESLSRLVSHSLVQSTYKTLLYQFGLVGEHFIQCKWNRRWEGNWTKLKATPRESELDWYYINQGGNICSNKQRNMGEVYWWHARLIDRECCSTRYVGLLGRILLLPYSVFRAGFINQPSSSFFFVFFFARSRLTSSSLISQILSRKSSTLTPRLKRSGEGVGREWEEEEEVT